MGLYASFGVAYALAGHYKIDQLSSGLLAVLAFLLTSVVPVNVTESVDGVIEAGRWLDISSLSAQSLFGGIVTSLLTVEIFRFFLYSVILRLSFQILYRRWLQIHFQRLFLR